MAAIDSAPLPYNDSGGGGPKPAPLSAAGSFTTLSSATQSRRWVQKAEGQSGSGQGRTLRGVLSGGEGKHGILPMRLLLQSKPDVSITVGAMLQPDPIDPEAYVLSNTATKVIIKTLIMAEGDPAPELELSCMQRVTAAAEGKESHVIRLLDAMRDDKRMFLVIPFMEGGDLFERVELAQAETGGGIPPAEAHRYFTHILLGLMELKKQGIAHGDLSLENVMLTCEAEGGEDGLPTAHIIDLGSVCVPAPGETTIPPTKYCYRGKLGCVPPEVVMGDPLAPVDPFAVDVWCLGVCMYAMLTGRPLYLKPDDDGFRVLSQGRVGELIDHYARFGLTLDPLAGDLVCAMLHPDPRMRMTLEQVAEHPWAVAGPCLDVDA